MSQWAEKDSEIPLRARNQDAYALMVQILITWTYLGKTLHDWWSDLAYDPGMGA